MKVSNKENQLNFSGLPIVMVRRVKLDSVKFNVPIFVLGMEMVRRFYEIPFARRQQIINGLPKKTRGRKAMQ